MMVKRRVMTSDAVVVTTGNNTIEELGEEGVEQQLVEDDDEDAVSTDVDDTTEHQHNNNNNPPTEAYGEIPDTSANTGISNSVPKKTSLQLPAGNPSTPTSTGSGHDDNEDSDIANTTNKSNSKSIGDDDNDDDEIKRSYPEQRHVNPLHTDSDAKTTISTSTSIPSSEPTTASSVVDTSKATAALGQLCSSSQQMNNNKNPKIRKRTEFLPTATIPKGHSDDDNDNNNDDDDLPPIRYYRIVYRGVVALLSEPPPPNNRGYSSSIEGGREGDYNKTNNNKSGAYLSYGEIIASRKEILVEVEDDDDGDHAYNDGSGKRGNEFSQQPATPQRGHPSPRLGSAVSSPILSDVWERQQRQQLPPTSPTRSGISTASSHGGSVHVIYDISKDVDTSFSVANPREEDMASAVTTSTLNATVERTRKRRMIRVDRVLTGGYAVDATDMKSNAIGSTHVVNNFAADVKAYEKTPKRGNGTYSMLVAASNGAPSMMESSALPIAKQWNFEGITNDGRNSTNLSMKNQKNTLPKQYEPHRIDEEPKPVLGHSFSSANETGSQEDRESFHGHGYMFLEQNHLPIAAPITDRLPECEKGSFLYRVVSSTPLPIMTGPLQDAPKTKGILIPGSVHEVCLKVSSDDGRRGTFLRLTRRRGWVMSGKVTTKRNDQTGNATSQRQWVTTMKELPPDDADGTSVASRVSTTTVSSAIATPISAARLRHKPPRRRQRERMAKDVIDSASLPRHVIGPALATRNDTSTLTDTSMSLNNGAVQQLNNDPRAIMSPSSNISLLSDESSLEHHQQKVTTAGGGQPLTPDRSVARSTASSSSSNPSFYLMRVNAPRGLKILDAPHFQVNNLIHGTHSLVLGPSGSGGSGQSHVHSTVSPLKESGNQSIFQTMTGHNHTTTMTSKIGNPAVFDSVTKSRKLPRGTVFEASKRMEAPGAFGQGAGLIKLSDNSGWAIVPRQDELDEQYRNYSGALAHTREGEATRAFEEVGNALPDDPSRQASPLFLRVLSKGGLSVSLPPLPSTESDVETSPTSSTTGSSAVSGIAGLVVGGGMSQDNSDVASSVASSFLDAFRTPRKHRERDPSVMEGDGRKDLNQHNQNSRPPVGERSMVSTVIPCGMCVEVDRWADPSDMDRHSFKNEYARIRGGQGWIPRFVSARPVVETVPPPEVRFGSFWFRVQDQRGIKVRLGPSRRAPSIKSDDGVYFRFECGEFLRASEVITFFRRNSSIECFAKLYRNRHIRLQTGIHGEMRPLASLTTQAEWVQVFGDGSLFLDECAAEPRIERHRQGWRYNVVLDARVAVRKGPSLAAETDGVVLLGGESVLVNERVTGPDETITWLRLKEGLGWVHTVGINGETLMIPHSLRHRASNGVTGRPSKADRNSVGNTGQDDIAYNTIIARLFHNDLPGNKSTPRRSSQRLGR
jgi:hypothetical protein